MEGVDFVLSCDNLKSFNTQHIYKEGYIVLFAVRTAATEFQWIFSPLEGILLLKAAESWVLQLSVNISWCSFWSIGYILETDCVVNKVANDVAR